MGPPALGGTILHSVHKTGRIGAVGATEHVFSHFYTVTDDPAQTVAAGRRHCLNRALEAVEDMTLPLNDKFKAFVVFVPAFFACRH
jgi:hypothetical protein